MTNHPNSFCIYLRPIFWSTTLAIKKILCTVFLHGSVLALLRVALFTFVGWGIFDMSKTAFPSTHWSLLLDTNDSTDKERSRKALEELLLRYEKPLLKHLMFDLNHGEHEAKDLLQGFIADQILEKSLIQRADQNRGRFRNLLLRSLQNYCISQWRKNQSRPTLTSVASDDGHFENINHGKHLKIQADIFHVEWAREVLREALLKSEQHFVTTDRSHYWRLFEIKFLEPILNHSKPATYEQIAHKLDFHSPSEVASALVTTKRHVLRQLQEAIREYVAEEDQVEEEIAELWKILSMPRA